MGVVSQKAFNLLAVAVLAVAIPTGNAMAGFTHWVSPGESLWSISQAYGVDLYALRQANGIWSDLIYPGQSLWIPTDDSGSGWRGGNLASRGGGMSRDLYLLAKVIYAEARGQPFEGQVAVGAVVLNRLKAPGFPKTIAEVIYQYADGAYQFTCVMDGQINLEPDATAYQAARAALSGWDPTYGSLYYYNPARATSWYLAGKQVTTVIGDHVFLK